ncbi:MAG: glycosyltransferase [Chloroflexota bacterium]
MMKKVSIVMITYNHEKFIEQAIMSVVNQETDFEYELIIGEDCSPDNTRVLVTALRDQYPDKIQAILPEKNMGAHKNFVQTLRSCRGEYIAVLDGDDYWTDVKKLQKQVDFLDSHPECSICFHDVTMIYDQDGKESRPYYRFPIPERSTIEDLLDKTYILPATVMFRNGLIADEPPKMFRNLLIGDWPRFVQVAEHGDVGFINEKMAVYRNHAGGVFSKHKNMEGEIKLESAKLAVYNAMNTYFLMKPEYKRYEPILKRRIADICYDLAKLHARNKDWPKVRRYVVKGWVAQPRFQGFVIKFLLYSCFPQILMRKRVNRNLRRLRKILRSFRKVNRKSIKRKIA